MSGSARQSRYLKLHELIPDLDTPNIFTDPGPKCHSVFSVSQIYDYFILIFSAYGDSADKMSELYFISNLYSGFMNFRAATCFWHCKSGIRN
jgi:hypothetical protein